MIELIVCASLAAIDGDTIDCQGQRMRILGDGAPYESGVNAPEMGHRADCPAEESLALRARDRLQALLETPGMAIEDSGEVDRFDRPLVTVRLPDGSTAGQTLINEGLAREWRPGVRNDWC